MKLVTGDPTDSRSVRALAKGEDVFIVAVGGADNTVWLRAAQTLVETLKAIPGTIPRILHMGGGYQVRHPCSGHNNQGGPHAVTYRREQSAHTAFFHRH